MIWLKASSTLYTEPWGRSYHKLYGQQLDVFKEFSMKHLAANITFPQCTWTTRPLSTERTRGLGAENLRIVDIENNVSSSRFLNLKTNLFQSLVCIHKSVYNSTKDNNLPTQPIKWRLENRNSQSDKRGNLTFCAPFNEYSDWSETDGDKKAD